MNPFRNKKITALRVPAMADLRKRARILVIDDDENSFPFALLRKEGYAIDWWPRIEDLSALEQGQYDIIFLDIQGVAQDYSSDDGLGILEHLKLANPSQVVVAFSAHSYDLSKNRFWKLADDSLSKPVEVAKCKRLIDNLIENKMTVAHYWSAVLTILTNAGVRPRKIAHIEDTLVRALENNDRERANQVLQKALDNAEVAVRLAAIGVKIAALFGL